MRVIIAYALGLRTTDDRRQTTDDGRRTTDDRFHRRDAETQRLLRIHASRITFRRPSSVVHRLSSVVIALTLYQCYAIVNGKLNARWVDAGQGDACGGDAVAA
ncbi:MAG TPA: hypothetical protein VJ183_14825 [Chloroflexia bacterium]|nr:hypothetical protein [Chloroflexia bacterium]